MWGPKVPNCILERRKSFSCPNQSTTAFSMSAFESESALVAGLGNLTLQSASKTSEWTPEEVESARQTKKLLQASKEFDQRFLSDREIFLTTVNCKFRPEKAAEKMIKWTNEMKSSFGINSFADVYAGIGPNGDAEGADKEWERLSSLFTAYAGCGLDKAGRSIMWIRTRPTSAAEERDAVRCGVIYFTAVHADLVSMRNGITFVIDTANNDMVSKTGNEGKLQRVYQSIPLRPQSIFILGAGWIKRALINAVIAFASLFTKDKVIDRVRFATMEEVLKDVDVVNLPAYAHPEAKGGGLGADNSQVVDYVRRRIREFPEVPSNL
jgi:hypothetical protein